MSRRNKDRDININLTEDALEEIIECVSFKAGSVTEDIEMYEEYVRFIHVLQGYLTRFRTRKELRNAQRQESTGTSQGNTGQSTPLSEVRETGISHQADSSRDVQDLY